jgi:hypothetical protein
MSVPLEPAKPKPTLAKSAHESSVEPDINNWPEWQAREDTHHERGNPLFAAGPVQQTSSSPTATSATAQAEAEPFLSTIPQSSAVADPDELLDALTERIVRDFRRYYPIR